MGKYDTSDGIHTNIYIYVYICERCLLRSGAEIWAQGMRSVTSGLSTGGSLALAYKVLNWVERQPVVPSPSLDFCEALAPRGGLDWFSVLVGIFVGLVLYAFVDLVVSLRLAIVRWGDSIRRPGEGEGERKPLYKLC